MALTALGAGCEAACLAPNPTPLSWALFRPSASVPSSALFPALEVYVFKRRRIARTVLTVLTVLAIGAIGSACLLGATSVGPKKVFAASPLLHGGTLGVGARTVAPLTGSVTAMGKIHVTQSADATALATLSLPSLKRVTAIRTVRKTTRKVVRRSVKRVAVAPKTSYTGVRGTVAAVARSKGLNARNVDALLRLCARESSFNPRARNHSYYGLFQLHSSMVQGQPWYDPAWNTARAIQYIKGRYGSAVRALSHSYSYGWY
jgi:hypothetical protein